MTEEFFGLSAVRRAASQNILMRLKTIKSEAVETFTTEMERLRRKAYMGKDSDICTEDEFDAQSTYVAARCVGELIGMVRLTMNPVSVLLSWAGNLASVPDQKEIAELTRGLTAKNWGGKDIFKLLIAEAMIYAAEMNVKQTFAFTEPRLNH